MKKRGKQFFLQQIAIFLSFLVFTIPFLSANAFALSITNVTVAGSNGVEDVMSSQNDYFTADVQTSEAVDESQLEISYTKQESFDDCSGTSCTYTSSQTDRSGQEMAYTIQLINNSIVVDEVEGTILVDENAPEITDYSVEKSGEDMTLSYEVSDTACDDCSGCAGIDLLSILVDDVETQEINVASECDLSDEIDTSVSELNLADGDHEICMIAVDNVGHESDSSCASVSVDSTGPHFETNSMQVTEAVTGNAVEYIGAEAVLVNVVINVTDSSLNENTVAADFSDLNGVIGDTYANVTADSCEQSDDDETLYACSWTGIYVEDVSGTIKIPFYAQDNQGNEGTYSPTITLTKDDSAPTVVQTYNEVGGEDLYFKSGTNSLYADFDPTGSAMSYGHTYLTFGLASLSKEDATACFENGSYWTCVWNFSMSYSGTVDSTITIDATDDAGNEMESYEVDVQTDSTEPEITSMEKSLDCPTGSDTLEVTINATDDGDHLYASFYGEDVRTNNDAIIEECTDLGDGNFTCLIDVNDLVSYAEDENVNIEVSDDAGNIAEDELSVSVCELEESGTPNLVTLYVDENEIGAVDKLTLSYIDYPVYVPMTFSMPSSAHIVSKTTTCEAGSAYFIDQSETSSLMVLTLDQQTVPNATAYLNVNCSISMTMQYGDNVYANPETDTVEFNIDLYGTPLGNIEDAINANIETQKDWIAKKQKNIDTLVALNTVLGIMCKIVDLLTKVDATMSLIRSVTTLIAYAAYGTFASAMVVCDLPLIVTNIVGCPTAASAWATYAAMVQYEAAANTYHAVIVDFIWPIGYGHFSFGTIIRAGCIIYSGKLCEGFSGLKNDILINAKEQGTPAYYKKSTGQGEGAIFGQEDQQLPESFPEQIGLFYDWDPYKSIHTARNCLYVDAIIYNLRKERQINCMDTHCLEENAKNGLPTEICDVQFKERECLYVDGAAWNAVGSPDVVHFFQLTLNTALANAELIAAGTLYWFLPPCSFWEDLLFIKGGIAAIDALHLIPTTGPASSEGAPGAGMAQGTICHASYNILALMETNWFYGVTDWDFTAPLEGTDYCVGYE